MERQPLGDYLRDEMQTPEVIGTGGGLVWSELAPEIQIKMSQDWVTRHWTNLLQFCHAHGLDYESVRHVFRRKKILDRSALVISNGDTTKAQGAVVQYVRELAEKSSIILAKLAYKLYTDDKMTLGELLLMLERFGTEAGKMAYTAGALKSIQMNSVELSSGFGQANVIRIPAEVQKSIRSQLSNVGENLVKNLELKEKE